MGNNLGKEEKEEEKRSEGKKEDVSLEEDIKSENENEKEKKVKIPLYTFDDLFWTSSNEDIEKLKEMLPHCLHLLEQQTPQVNISIFFSFLFPSFLLRF
jgi:hypothetical protein